MSKQINPLADELPIRNRSIAEAVLALRDRVDLYAVLCAGLTTFCELDEELDSLAELLDEADQLLRETACHEDTNETLLFHELAETLEAALSDLDLVGSSTALLLGEEDAETGHPCCLAVGRTILDHPPEDWICRRSELACGGGSKKPSSDLENDCDELLERIVNDIRTHGYRLHAALIRAVP